MQNSITVSEPFSFNSTGEKNKKHKVSVIIPAIIIIWNTISASNEKVNSNYASKVVGSEITMNDKNTYSTQQVRQKDIDDAQAIEDEKIDKYYKLLEQKIESKYEYLSSQINSTKDQINQNVNARNKRTTWIISLISIAVTLLGIAVNVVLFFLRK